MIPMDIHLLKICSILFLMQMIETSAPVNGSSNRQMCTKLQSMLSFGKYYTYPISSDIPYVPRGSTQNFLAYSPVDDLLIFIEPKYQVYVYNAKTVQLIASLPLNNILIGTSTISLVSNNRYDLYFIYETSRSGKLISLRLCQVRFNLVEVNFENQTCLQTLVISHNRPNLTINGFAIKRDHGGTRKSLLFISTNIGLIHTIFDTQTGALLRTPTVMTDTSNDGSIVVSSSGTVYYANRHEHTIYELLIGQDFRIRYGKMIKSNAIKNPDGLITDECNHLFIVTKSMILIMYVQTYSTIRGVPTKLSDLPITIERVNATTYVYTTMRQTWGSKSSIWFFNFLSFTDPETTTTQKTRTTIVSTKTTLSTILDFTSSNSTSENPLDSTGISERSDVVTSTLSDYLSSPVLITSDGQNSLTVVHSPTTNSSLSTNTTTLETTSPSDYLTNEDTQTLSWTDSLDNDSQNRTVKSTTFSTEQETYFGINSPSPTEISSVYTPNVTTTSRDSSSIINSSTVVTEAITQHDQVEQYFNEVLTTRNSYSTSSTTIDAVDRTSAHSTLIPTSKINELSTDESFQAPPFIDRQTLTSTIVTTMQTFLSSDENHLQSRSFQPTQIPSTTLNHQTDHVLTTISSIKSKDLTKVNRIDSSSSPRSTLMNVILASTRSPFKDSPSDRTTIATTVDIPSKADLHRRSEMTPSTHSPLTRTKTLKSTELPTISDPIVTTNSFALITVENTSVSTSSSPSLSVTSFNSAHISPISPKQFLSSIKTFSATTTIPTTTEVLAETTFLPVTTNPSTPLPTTTNPSTPLPTTTNPSTPLPTTTNPLTSSLLPTTMETTVIVETTNEPQLTSIPSSSVASTTFTTVPVLLSTERSTLLPVLSTLSPTSTEQYFFTPSQPLPSSTTEESIESTTIPTDVYSDSTFIDESSTFPGLTTIDESTSSNTDQTSVESLSTLSFISSSLSTPSPEIISTSESTLAIALVSSVQWTRPENGKTSDHRGSFSTLPALATHSVRTRKRTLSRLRFLSSTFGFSTLTSTLTTSLFTETSVLKPTTAEFQTSSVVFQLPSDSRRSKAPISNDLLQSLLNSSRNQSIYLDLSEISGSSWNFSLQTNESLLLDIALPSNSTNLTLANIQADRFKTNIMGPSVNLKMDQIQTKEFSLTMNLTNNGTPIQSSDVIIGHIKTDQFQLDIKRSNKMNLQVQQVESDTAELVFDSRFCTNVSDMGINLNLAKNGTIRFGNRPPLRIGPVFARVHMMKHSCDREQPLVLFFDLCERENPCLNGGTCQSLPPDYKDPAYITAQPTEINYRCLCPSNTTGEHCQYLHFPFGRCANGGTLIDVIDEKNQLKKICSCSPGFTGEHCEENIDDCKGIVCSHNGICSDHVQNYTCACFDGYYGDLCQNKQLQTIVIRAVNKSFAVVAILLIASIAALVVISDIHTYLTNRKPSSSRRMTSIEMSTRLLESNDIQIEMNDFSRKPMRKRASNNFNHRSTSYHRLSTSQLSSASNQI